MQKEKCGIMKTTEEYVNILRSKKTYLMEKYRIAHLGIFGSVARHTQTATSDVDICFESDSISLFTLCRLKAELEDLLDCSVDLLRMRKQIEGSYLETTIKRDMIYV